MTEADMENQEVWKDIEDYEYLYQISTFANVKSLPRYINSGSGIRKTKERILKPSLTNKGYYFVNLCNGFSKSSTIHRMLAIAFIPNPENKPEVNHKNGIKTDLRIENLEWCTHKENMQHAHDMRLIDRQYKSVLQYSKNGEFIAEYFSQTEATRKTGIDDGNISSACTGKRKTAGNYIWKFKN